MKCKSELDTFLPHKSMVPLPSSPNALQVLALCLPQAPSLCYGDKRARILGPCMEGTLCSWPTGSHQEHPGTQEFRDGLIKKLPQALSWGRRKQLLTPLCTPLTLLGPGRHAGLPPLHRLVSLGVSCIQGTLLDTTRSSSKAVWFGRQP